MSRAFRLVRLEIGLMCFFSFGLDLFGVFEINLFHMVFFFF